MQSDVRKQMSASRPEKWTAGVDWYRFIVDKPGDIPLARDRADYLMWEDEKRASSVKPWKFQGFQGWASDRIRYGERGGKLLWECSGEQAADTMARMGSFTGYSSRIDLQTTWKLSTGQPQFGTSLLGCSQETIRRRPYSQTQIGLSVSSTGLWLGTVGRRTSPSYWRLYDKGVESKQAPPGVLWRLELECKGRLARTLGCKFQKELQQPTLCGRFLVQRWKSSGFSWPFEQYTDAPLDTALLAAPPMTALRLARWLRSSVAPTIPRLLTVYTVAELLEMLKLSDVAAPTGRAYAQRSTARNVDYLPAPVASEREVHRPKSFRMDRTNPKL